MDKLDELKIKVVDLSTEQYRLSKKINELDREKQQLITQINQKIGIDSDIVPPKIGEYILPE